MFPYSTILKGAMTRYAYATVAIAHAEACMTSRRAYNIYFIRTSFTTAHASKLSLVFLNEAVIPLCAH